MATLTVTQSPTHDFTGDVTLNVTDIDFAAGADTTAIFNSVQFNDITIDADVEIGGDAFANTLRVNMVSDTNFSATLFTFANWSSNDLISIVGSSSADTITGSFFFVNRIEGGGGADTITGGDDNDTVVYALASDLVVGESVNGLGGTDTLLLQGAGAFNFSSKTVLNIEVLQFAAAAGALLAPAQVGATAISTIVGTTGAQFIQISGSNVDLSAVTFTGWTDGEDTITVFGSLGSDTLTGSTQGDRLAALDGADTLDGRGGADLMQGGAGDDTYVVDEAGDVVDESEPGSDGTDTVRSEISFNLSDSTHVKGAVENLTLFGTALNATGNGLSNVLTGNGSANVLDGLGGADIMRGRGGNDTYVVDNAGDVVSANLPGSDGIDTVRSSISFSLADPARVLGFVENLVLLTGAANGTGNALANTITGNAAANMLDGGGGADIMRGGGGDDTYTVDNSSDVVDESVAGSGGTDLIRSSVTFSLADAAQVKGSVENLTLIGAGSINGAGNGLANVITGNAGANRLTGGLGPDRLAGGLGPDAFVFLTLADSGKKKTSRDTILDFDADDFVDLSAIDARKGGEDDKFKFIKKQPFHDKRGELHYEKKNGAVIVSGDVNGDGKADFAILLDNINKVVKGDFVL